jgi:hypothetical protein
MSRNLPLLMEMKYEGDEKDIRNSDVESQELAFGEEESKPKNCCKNLYGCLSHYSFRILAGVTSAGALVTLGIAIYIGNHHSPVVVPSNNAAVNNEILYAAIQQIREKLNAFTAGVIAGSLGMTGLMFTTFHLYWKKWHYQPLQRELADLRREIQTMREEGLFTETKHPGTHVVRTDILHHPGNSIQDSYRSSSINN